MVKTKAKLVLRGEVSSDTVKYVDEALTACWKALLKKEHELFADVPFKVGLPHFRERTNIAVYGGYGGSVSYSIARNGIQISLRPQSYRYAGYNEYKRFEGDKVIGTLQGSYRKKVFALVAHELTHWYVDRYATYCPWLKSRKSKYDRATHGTKFQDVYRILRANVVNPME